MPDAPKFATPNEVEGFSHKASSGDKTIDSLGDGMDDAATYRVARSTA